MISVHECALLSIYILPFLAQQIRSEERESIAQCLKELEEMALKSARYNNYSYGCTLLYLLC